MVKKILILIVVLPFLIWMLAPKKELIYLAEKQLAKQGIVIADGAIHEHLFGASIDHPSIYVKGIKVATIERISFWSVLLYTRGEIGTIVFDPTLASYVPPRIEHIEAVHSVIAPLKVALTITDTLYGGTGQLDLAKRNLTVVLPNVPETSPIKRYLKKTQGGWTYAKTF